MLVGFFREKRGKEGGRRWVSPGQAFFVLMAFMSLSFSIVVILLRCDCRTRSLVTGLDLWEWKPRSRLVLEESCEALRDAREMGTMGEQRTIGMNCWFRDVRLLGSYLL